jgi:hypothetical protein
MSPATVPLEHTPSAKTLAATTQAHVTVQINEAAINEDDRR